MDIFNRDEVSKSVWDEFMRLTERDSTGYPVTDTEIRFKVFDSINFSMFLAPADDEYEAGEAGWGVAFCDKYKYYGVDDIYDNTFVLSVGDSFDSFSQAVNESFDKLVELLSKEFSRYVDSTEICREYQDLQSKGHGGSSAFQVLGEKYDCRPETIWAVIEETHLSNRNNEEKCVIAEVLADASMRAESMQPNPREKGCEIGLDFN